MIYLSRLLSTTIVLLITLACFGFYVQQINAMECSAGYEPSPDDTMCIPTGNSDTGSYEMGSAYNNTQETDDQYTSVDSVSGGAGGAGSGSSANTNSGSGNSVNTNDGGGNSNNGGGNTNSGGSTQLKNPLKSQSIEDFILKIIDVLLVLALQIIILYIMYVGYLFVTAQGDSGQISTARSALLWAVVGGVIVLGAKVIVAVIQGTIRGF